MKSPLHFQHFKKIHQGQSKRVFAVGDVHGCFDELQLLLQKIHFDPTQDIIIFLGDLGDRGPKSKAVFDFVLDKPWFHLVAGNHEDLLVEHITRSTSLPRDMMEFWLQEEGGWITALSNDELLNLARKLRQQSFCAIELQTSTGVRFGLTHAGFDENRWFQEGTDYEDKQFRLLAWSRMRAESDPSVCHPVQGIDFTVHGHTIFSEAQQKANSLFIDTGCCIGGKLTALDLTTFCCTQNLSASTHSV